jgi:hypothetical protein
METYEHLTEDAVRQECLFAGLHCLLDRRPPKGSFELGEEGFRRIAARPDLDEVWSELLPICQKALGADTGTDIKSVIEEAQSLSGVRVPIGTAEGMREGNIILLIGYNLDDPIAIDGLALIGDEKRLAPVTIWPNNRNVYEAAPN